MIIALILICSCQKATQETGSTTVIQTVDSLFYTNDRLEEMYEPVDTAEFVLYCERFRKAILERYTAALSPMINDSITGGKFLIGNYMAQTDKISKTVFLENLYTLFVPTFLSLLKSYDISNDLFSKRDQLGVKEYYCDNWVGNKKYFASMIFNDGLTMATMYYYDPVVYCMGYIVTNTTIENYAIYIKDDILEKDLGVLDNITFHLSFIQISSKIKLNKLRFTTISIAES